MNSNKNKSKVRFFNFKFLLLVLGYFVGLILIVPESTKDIIRYSLCYSIFIIAYIIYFYLRKTEENHFQKISEGKLEYEPYFLDYNRFVKECEKGFVGLIRVNDKIYELLVEEYYSSLSNQLSHFTNDYKCFINKQEITGLDNFLNYKFDGETSLSDLEKIEVLEFCGNDPRAFFEDNKD